MGKIILSTFIFITTLCYSQSKNNGDLYMSGYITDDFNIPFWQFARVTNDSIYFLNPKSKFSVSRQNFQINKNITSYKLNRNKLSIIYNDAINEIKYHFFKVDEVTIDSSKIEKLNSKRFITSLKNVSMIPNSDLKIIRELHFLNSSKIQITYFYFLNDQIIYIEKEDSKFISNDVNEKFFINFDSEITDNTRNYQLIEINDESFMLNYYAENEKISEKYKLTNNYNEPFNACVYKMCFEKRPHEYYNYTPDISYLHGNNALLKRLNKNAPLTKGNGYITIHFAINCEGKVGRFGLEQIDENYKPASYNPLLIKHLINEISKITEWVIPTNLNNDVHRFYMFKIIDGKITEV